MHYATDSLARAARTEHDTVRTAAAARRLYVTTRSLPETYDVRRPYANAPRYRVADALAAYADTAEVSQVALHSAAYAAAAVDAPSWVLSAADQATAGLVVAPRGRLEQHLLDLGVRDAELLRKGVDLDDTGTAGSGSGAPRWTFSLPPSAVEAVPELDTAEEPAAVARPARPELATAEEVAADEPAEVARPAEAAADEPEIDGGLEIGLD